jgi:transcriptional regulator with XRE-family HTH domain
VLAEDNLARRIAAEREARGWTYDGLAKRMTDAGCPMNQSALYKIEQLTPRRRITVDELVAFSRVFGVPVEQLLLPPEIALADELAERVLEWDQAQARVTAAEKERDGAWDRVSAWVRQYPEHADKVAAVLRRLSERVFESDDRGHDFRTAAWMFDLTRDLEWGRRAKGLLDELVTERQASE